MQPQTTSPRPSAGPRSTAAVGATVQTPPSPTAVPPRPAIEPRPAATSRAAATDVTRVPDAPSSPPATEPYGPGPRAVGGDADDTRAELQRALEGGQIPRAQSILGAVEGHRAEDADLFYAVGEALLRAGEPEVALQTLDDALSRDPAHVEARYRRALALLALGRGAEARDEFARVLDLRPEGPLADGARKALGALAPAGSSR